jgi:hypothetical protein
MCDLPAHRCPLLLHALSTHYPVRVCGSGRPGDDEWDLNSEASTRRPKPPGDVQNFFAGSIWEIETHNRLHRLHLEKPDELFASLHYRAFRGEL